ncbi:O-antigen ligase family protein [Candidatus Sumerlaeota bacterium]|nr:O-antigen ligase family protein [Candidatus Sumerlaeota bacterium]
MNPDFDFVPLEFEEFRSSWSRTAWRIALALAAFGLLATSLSYALNPRSAVPLHLHLPAPYSLIIFTGCFFLGLASRRLLTDALLLIAPLAVMPLYSMTELGLRAGLAGLLLRAAWRPRMLKSSCALTPALLFMCGVTLFSLVFNLIQTSGFFNGYLWRMIAHCSGCSVELMQDCTENGFTTVFAMINATAVFHLALFRAQEGGLRRMIAALLIGALGASGFAILQYFFPVGLVEFYSVSDQTTRVNGTFTDPNTLGTYLTLTAGIGAASWFGRGALGPRKLGGAVFIVSAIAVILTRSDIAWLGMLLLIGWIVLWSFVSAAGLTVWLRRRRIPLLAGVILAFFACWALIMQINVTGDNFYTVLDWMYQDNFITRLFRGRFAIWRRCLMLIDLHPFWGVQTGRLYMAISAMWAPVASEWNPISENAHNQFLQYCTELGPLGGLGALLLFVLPFWRLIQLMSAESGPRRMGFIALGGGWLGCCLTMTTGHPLIVREMLYVFAAATALLYLPIEADTGAARESAFRKIDPWLPAWVALLLLLIPLSVDASRYTDFSAQLYGASCYADYDQHILRAWPMDREVHIRGYKTTPLVRLEILPKLASPEEPLNVTVRIGDQEWKEELSGGGWRTLDCPLSRSVMGKPLEMTIAFDRYYYEKNADGDRSEYAPYYAELQRIFQNFNFESQP